MAGKSSLPTGWQALLENPAGCRPYLTVTLDPDGENIALSGFHGVQSISSVIGEVDIDPKFASEFVLSKIRISFTDPDEYFAAFTGRASRYFKRIQRITAETTSGNNPVDLETGLGEFVEGDVVTITDGTNSESFTANANTTTNAIGWAGSLSSTYAAGSLISTIPVTGNEVEVKLYIDGNANALTIYKGIVNAPFEWDGTQASLEIDNYLGRLFDKPMRIHASSPTPTAWAKTSGAIESSFAWSESATTSLSAITVYTGAKLGVWTVTIGEGEATYKKFTVTGPGEYTGSGRTDTNFFDVTDATDSQIQIPAANWTTPTTGDVLTFYVSANFEAKTWIEIAYEILSSYAGLTDDFIDVGGTGVTDTSTLTYSFNECYNTSSGDTFSLSINQEEITIMEALLTVLPHGIGFLGQLLNGKIGAIMLDPDFAMTSVTPSVVGNPVVSRENFVNQFTVRFAWDQPTQDYVGIAPTWPESTATNPSYKLHDKLVTQTVDCPGFNS